MTELQALVIGTISGALVGSPFKIGVELETDKDGNYTNKILITSHSSDEEILVTVAPFGDAYDGFIPDEKWMVKDETSETEAAEA